MLAGIEIPGCGGRGKLWQSLLCSAVLRSRADSLRSHVILHEWIAFYTAGFCFVLFFKYPPERCTYYTERYTVTARMTPAWSRQWRVSDQEDRTEVAVCVISKRLVGDRVSLNHRGERCRVKTIRPKKMSPVKHERIIKQRMETIRPKTEPCGTRKNYKAKNGDDKTKNGALCYTKEL